VQRFRRPLRNAVFLILAAMMYLPSGAQEQKAPGPITPSARLAAAKTAFLKGAVSSSIPYDVVESSLEGWGRFTLVDSPAQADIVVEITSLGPGGAGISGPTVSASNRGHVGPSAGSQQEFISQLRLAVYDAKTKILLWSAMESVKSGWHKKKTYEDNLIEASGRLVSRLREQIEPTPGK